MFKIRNLAFVLLLLQMNFAQAEGPVKGAAGSRLKGDVEVVLQQFKVVVHNGAEELKPVERIKPGEIIQYQATYSNVSDHAVHQLQANLPIPPETEYLPGSAKPAIVEASTDGVTYAAVPLRKKVLLANGKTEERDVPVSEYRSLRWAIGDINAGQKVSVYARIRLAPVASAEGVKR
ncbi:MAG: hypothetical protein PHP85_09860 [Gallionella sp.]|nr:hypothetical protein [Gallionella sp.]